MISRQQRVKRGFRSRSETRKDEKDIEANDYTTSTTANTTTAATKTRGRSFSLSSRTSIRSRSTSTTRDTNKATTTAAATTTTIGPTVSPQRTKKKLLHSLSSPRKSLSSSSSSSTTTSLSNNDVLVVLSPTGRIPLKRTFSTSTTSSTGGTSTKSSVANDSRDKDIAFVPPASRFLGRNNNNNNTSPDQEVDFFTNPTVLSRLIHNQKFGAAISRLEKQGPAEACIWVCTKRKLPPAALQSFAPQAQQQSPECSDHKRGPNGTAGNGNCNTSSRSLVSYTSTKASITSKKGTSSSPSSPTRKSGSKTKTNHTGDSSTENNNSSNNATANNNTTNNESQFTFRQLPIHMACGSLFRVQDPTLRQDLEQLIARLVIAYPDGCARRDHQGRYPLHECIWYNAAPPIVSALLMAAPEIARLGDLQGVTPLVLNEHRNCPNPVHKKMVRGMLKKSPEFWRAARKEAELRMKHRDIPASDATITSTSVLASSVVEEETIASSSGEKKKQQQQQQQQLRQQQQKQKHDQLLNEVRQLDQPVLVPPPPEQPDKPLEWTQLEKRAVALEQKLSESYEHIYMLNQQINELKGAKNALQHKVDKFANTDLGQRVVTLENEKDELQFHLARSQALLAKHGISLENENIAEGMPPLPPLHISFESRASSTEDTAAITTSDDGNNGEIVHHDPQELYQQAEDEENKDAKAKLAMLLHQKKLALNLLGPDHAQHQERVQYFRKVGGGGGGVPQQQPSCVANNGEIDISHDDDDDGMTAKSEITTDDFTAMTPASRFYPKRPEPDGSVNNGTPAAAATTTARSISNTSSNSPKKTSKMAAVMEDRVSSGLEDPPSPTHRHRNHEQQRHPSSKGSDGNNKGSRRRRSAGGSSVSSRGGGGGKNKTSSNISIPSNSDHTFELDSVIAGAMELNGGHGLSPDMVKLWKATSVSSEKVSTTSSSSFGKQHHHRHHPNNNSIGGGGGGGGGDNYTGNHEVQEQEEMPTPRHDHQPQQYQQYQQQHQQQWTAAPATISSGDSIQYTEEEERMMLAMVRSRPGADDSSLVSPHQRLFVGS
ncbi:hypothetical protein ACA910_018207 [Epithemia clementina (nom. ined.)]